MSAKNWLKFILLGALWGTSFMWIKIALREVGPFTLVTFRTFFASMGLVVALLLSKNRLHKRNLPVLLLLGLFNVALPFALISWAETHISSGMAAILNSTVPLFTILIAPFFLKEERLQGMRLAGLVIGFAGVVVLMSGELSAGDSLSGWGIAAMLVAACSYAASGILVKLKARGMHPTEQSLGQIGSGFLFILPAALTVEAPFTFPKLPLTYTALLWLGVLGSCVATLLWFSLLNSVGPTSTSMTTYLFPLMGVLLGLIFLGEVLSWRLVIGGILIIGAVVLVNTQSPRTSSGQAAVQTQEVE